MLGRERRSWWLRNSNFKVPKSTYHTQKQIESVILRSSIQVGGMIRHRISIPVEIISLHIHKIHDFPQRSGIETILNPKSGGGGGDYQQPTTLLEDFGEFLQKQSKELLVGDVASEFFGSWVLPVDVNAVEVVLFDEIDGGADEVASVASIGDETAETVGAVFSASSQGY